MAKKLLWIDTNIPMTKKEDMEYVGKPCKIFQRGCPCCEGWKSWNKKGTVKISFEKEELIGLLR